MELSYLDDFLLRHSGNDLDRLRDAVEKQLVGDYRDRFFLKGTRPSGPGWSLDDGNLHGSLLARMS